MITLIGMAVAIPVIYATGNEERKAKLRNIGKETVDITKEVANDVCNLTKAGIQKVKDEIENCMEKHMNKN